ncbi:MAG TPA: DUF3311 domain-containing protein [Spirochaetia bacterium]|nr:DUF3311 domain-containing protein [Spirochaetia bacterium]
MKVDRRPGRSKVWYVLLVIPFIGTMFPSFYSFDAPRLWGFPFFYWYQMLWVIISAVITFAVYLATREA